MIIGHIGVALGARRRWPVVPLSALLAATFAPDLLRGVLEGLMLRHADGNFYSHALPWSVLLAAAVAAVTWVLTRSRQAALVMAGVVMSHVALDMFSGTKPLWSGGPVGFDMRAFAPVELLIETCIAMAGWMYVRGGGDRLRWYAARWVPLALVAISAAYLGGVISQRPYIERCVAHPALDCDDSSWLTTRWNVAPFWD
jgi:hypothetical protein